MNSCAQLHRAPTGAIGRSEPAPFSSFALLIRIFLAALATAVSGCTIVRVQGADTAVTRRYLGIANVQITPEPGRSALIATEGLGAVSGPRSATLGWMKETAVLTSDLSECRTFIVVQTHEQLENLQRSLGELNDLCVFTMESGNDDSNHKK